MLYKEDWPGARERFCAWWENENYRPLIQVTASREGCEPFQAWWNWRFAQEPSKPEKTVKHFEGWCQKVFFGGEAYPNLWINLGPGIAATYMGAEARFRLDSETVWFETPKDWEELEKLRFNPSNRWWRTTKNITAYVSEQSEGKFMCGITDLGGVTDIAASLRGSQTLIADMFKNPEKVKSLSSRILELWHIYYEELYKMLQGEARGNSAWMGLWAPRKWYPIQCDFSAMLSPRLFRDLALPYIKEQCERLDYTIYHWDGPREIPHLDSLLSIPRLTGIQWTPGAGNPNVDSPTWFHLYRKIQEKGKRLVLLGASSSNIRPLLKGLRPEGLLVSTSCLTEKDAVSLLKNIEDWSES